MPEQPDRQTDHSDPGPARSLRDLVTSMSAAMLLMKIRMKCPGGEGILGKPIKCSPKLDQSRPTSLLGAWIYFNPYGPMIVQLSALRIGTAHVILLRREHPFSPSCHAVGIARETTLSDPTSCVNLLMPLFEREDKPIVGSLPTSVLANDTDGNPLTWLRPLFWAWCKRLPADEAQKATALTREHRDDPWERAQVALMQLLEQVKSPMSRPTAVMTPADFDAWWEMATDPLHCEADVTEFPNAWIGAIDNAQRGGKR